MWIMGQNEKSLFNVDRFDGIHIYRTKDDNNFVIVGIDKETGTEIDLAEYKTEDRAKDVLIDMLACIENVRYIMPSEN